MTIRPESSAPTQVGPYALLAKLGEGGMGIVHLAQGPDGQRVALKVLRPQIVGDEEARNRLAREVGSLTRVRSPWVAEMIDADPWAEVPYVVTRYVPGFSLHDHVAAEGPVTGRDLHWLAGCLAEGVAAVHAAGVLHRDIKPGNVLMEGRTPILIDFGLARVADDVRLTQTGWLLGTPGYLAPEVLYGDEPTRAVDVHAWAATVAYAASGRPPYGRGPGMAVMDRTRRGQHDLSGIEKPLADVLAAALDPDPLERPLLEELLAWLRPLSTRPDLPPAPSPAPELVTLPLVAATPTIAAPQTVVETSPTVAAMTRLEEQFDQQHGLVPADLTSASEPPLAERMRRWLTVGLGALGLGAGFAAAPWLTLAVTVLAVWLIRAGSLAASAVASRRTVRGIKWYDGLRWVSTSPWHLVRAITGTVVLVSWSAGLGIAAGLIAYAVGLDAATTLIITGASLGLALWTGPGSNRFRLPIGRVIEPMARQTTPWLITCAVLLAVAAGLGLLVAGNGVLWAPWTTGPFGR